MKYKSHIGLLLTSLIFFGGTSCSFDSINNNSQASESNNSMTSSEVTNNVETSELSSYIPADGTLYEVDGVKYYKFGSYPQTHVSDTSIISALDSLTTTNDRGYYSYNGEEYAKVTTNPYYSSGYVYSDGASITRSTTEYFKVEPIVWKVLSEGDNSYMICSYAILDQCVYYDNTYIRTIDGVDVYANNYEYSTLRAFLNGYSYYGQGATKLDTYEGKGFLNTAFTTTQKASIQTTNVDNSASSTGYSTNTYACDDTKDKVFPLSVEEVNTYLTNGINGVSKPTDYALAKGAYLFNSNGFYWLRSPNDYYEYFAWAMGTSGVLGGSDVTYPNCGVRPALKIIVE